MAQRNETGAAILPRDGSETAREVSSLFDQIQAALLDRGQLGLLTVTSISIRDGGADRWSDYERVLEEVSAFLSRYARAQLRDTDLLLDPLVTANTYVLMIGPPRDSRTLAAADVRLVQRRLASELKEHLRERLTPQQFERYGSYVGGAVVDPAPGIEIERVVYRGIEAAQADALSHSRLDTRQQAEDLREVLATGGVRIVYQPLVNLRERRVVGYEALTRLPGGKFQSPDLVFKIASEQGVLWSLERLCRQRALDALPPLDDEQLLFVNVEPDSFYDPRLRSDEFLAELDKVGLEPSRVVLELTERAAVKDFVAMRKVLQEVRKLGYPLALDDVGSGYAGLQTIAEIRPDYLKMDMALIRNLHLDPIRRELVRSIRGFADSTGTTLVAEGVESTEEFNTLAGAGVHCAQGFLFARPDNPPGVPDWDKITGGS